MKNKLVVFVSSSINELRAEREVVKGVLEAIPLTRPWIFEYASASADPLEESYLAEVRDCDLFILLLAWGISDPVCKEWQTAVAHNRRKLVFLKKVERSAEAETFVQSIPQKWAEFATPDELLRQVQEAVIDEIIDVYRRWSKDFEADALAKFAKKLPEVKLREWKELHHLLHKVNRASSVFRAEVRVSTELGHQARIRDLKREWENCLREVKNLKQFSEETRYIGLPFTEDVEGGFSGAPWAVEIVALQLQIEAAFEEENLQGLDDKAGEFDLACSGWLYRADWNLRDMVQRLYPKVK